jgi:hypothetical protein
MIVPEPPSPALILRPLALLGLAGGAIIAAVLLSKRRDAANQDAEERPPPKDRGWVRSVQPAKLPEGSGPKGKRIASPAHHVTR